MNRGNKITDDEDVKFIVINNLIVFTLARNPTAGTKARASARIRN